VFKTKKQEKPRMHKLNRRNFLKTSFVGVSGTMLTLRSVPFDDQTSPKKLITRKLGKTSIVLPVVSMGVMRADNPALVRAALKAGMVHLDTAHGYQKGKNEEMLGEVLRQYPRDSFVLATKVKMGDKEEMLSLLDISLKRLQMSYVDILYLHGVSSRDEALNTENLDFLKAVQAAGKVRHVGMSTHKNEPEVIRAAIESGVHEVVLSAINFKQDHYGEVKKATAEAAQAGVGIIAMKTMAGGFFDREKTKPINCKAALKWVLQDANVTTAIPGITSFDQLAENASVNEDLSMSEDEKGALLLGSNEQGMYCNGCDHCVSTCLRQLPVPSLMRAYMYTYGYRDPGLGREALQSLALGSAPCAGCTECSASCVKGFNLREKIADVSRLHAVPSEFLG
jgi:uncharacterized protein